MPFKSAAQRKFMYARHPEIAKRWSEEAKHKKSSYADLAKVMLKKRKKHKK